MADFIYVDNSNVWIEGMRVSAVAHLPVYLSAGYGFVLLSGVVLGLASRRRMDAGESGPAYARMWKEYCSREPA